MEKIVVANLKMNLNFKEIIDYLKKLENIEDQNLIVCPTLIYIPFFLNKKYKVGVQNCYFEQDGAYTGEISPYQIKSLGIDYVIIGHSERRNFFKEDDAILKKKVKTAIEAGLKVIFCIGESISEREMLKTIGVLKKQLSSVLFELNEEQLKNIIIAYEPIWAIGTGKEAAENDVFEAVAFIKKFMFKEKKSNNVVLYGGSVNLKNIEMLNQIKNVDGFLVGTASKKVEEIVEILKKVRS